MFPFAELSKYNPIRIFIDTFRFLENNVPPRKKIIVCISCAGIQRKTVKF